MDAENRILKLLENVGADGILQSEIPVKLNLSKSTVSEIISSLEEKGVVVRRKVSAKSYRVWLVKHFPEPIEGIARIGILKASEYPKVVSAAERIGAIVKVYDSSLKLTKDLVHGYVDVAASPLITQAFFGVLMKNIKIFRIVAMNGSGIVFSSSESEWFGCSEFSTMERNLRRYMHVKKIPAQIRYFSSPESMIEALDELRGIAIWEPYLTMLSDRKIEPFSDSLGDFICCTLAANDKFIEVNEDLLNEFLSEFDKAKYGKREAEILAELIGFDAEIIRSSFSSYIFDVEQELPEKELEELRFGRVRELFRFQ